MSLIDAPPSPAVSAPQDERALLARLRALHEAARIAVTIDRRKLSHLDFPLALEADSNQWVYAIVIVAGLVWWQLGTVAGLIACATGYLLYRFVGQRWVARRLERRIHTRGLGEVDTWRKLWRFGGVILTDPATGATCQGPEGRWMGFVQAIDRDAVP